MTRAYLARHRPSSRSLTVSTVCSLRHLADTLGPLPLLGFSLSKPFRAVGPGRLATSAASCRPRCSTISNSEEYEVGSSAFERNTKARPPWSLGRGSKTSEPPSEHIIPGPSQRLSLLLPPHALESSTAGRTIPLRTGAPGSLTDPGTGGSTRDPQLPWGSCCIRKTFWRLPMLDSIRHRHARQSWRFSGCHPFGTAHESDSGPDCPVDRGATAERHLMPSESIAQALALRAGHP
jgi:hypothetical protein